MTGKDFFREDINELKANFRSFEALPINYKELQKYIDIILNIKTRENGKKSYYISSFRPCTHEDFVNNNIANVHNAPNKFCPELDEVKDEWKLRNYEYSNDRTNYSIEIMKC